MSDRKRKELTRVTIHASLVRPLTFMGGERFPVMMGLLFCAYLAFVLSMRYGVWYGIPGSALAWVGWLGLMRHLASKDPMMWQVLKRHRKYRAFYPARGRMNAPPRAYKDFK
ncbi:VirB3 family type IV secretion system protein [Agrobacterium tumefaciens]|uniref:VirB3 family type IV secretion system protein n=1 Tax=Agrobacterium tumefaciens TaxID=358 RepID=UPI001573DD9A|nr:VirB3 family type IV secretion system protein [Agrobacterium tumefaciens]NTB05925.1 conjugal transfer protein [Agrobacterium tumefaciens]